LSFALVTVLAVGTGVVVIVVAVAVVILALIVSASMRGRRKRGDAIQRELREAHGRAERTRDEQQTEAGADPDR
jgi:Tfp pilus assembly protein PilE